MTGYEDEKLVVLHVLAPGRFGGLETVVHALAAGHQRRGHHIHVAAVVQPSYGELPFLNSLRQAGVEVHSVVVGTRSYVEEWKSVAALCRRFRPHVVHTHGYRPDIIAGGAARRQQAATVTTVHGFTGGGWKNRAYEWLQLRSFQQFDAVVAVSRPLVSEITRTGTPRAQVHLVPNAHTGGVPLLDRTTARLELDVPDGVFHLGWVGRLGREKAADVLIDALAYLEDIPLTVSVMGDGREGRALRERAAVLGVKGKICWHGAVENAARLFPAFDLFVLSSRSEGTPMVLMEAMSAGVPIVATRVGGVPDVVSTTEALLVPPDAPAELAHAIRQVYDDSSTALARTAAARERLDTTFGYEPWLTRYSDLYHHVRHRLTRVDS